MNHNEDDIIRLYTGGDIIVSRIKQELEAQAIFCLIKDDFKQGLAAGFGSGVPSAIDVYVRQKDLEKATEVVKAITEE